MQPFKPLADPLIDLLFHSLNKQSVLFETCTRLEKSIFLKTPCEIARGVSGKRQVDEWEEEMNEVNRMLVY